MGSEDFISINFYYPDINSGFEIYGNDKASQRLLNREKIYEYQDYFKAGFSKSRKEFIHRHITIFKWVLLDHKYTTTGFTYFWRCFREFIDFPYCVIKAALIDYPKIHNTDTAKMWAEHTDEQEKIGFCSQTVY